MPEEHGDERKATIKQAGPALFVMFLVCLSWCGVAGGGMAAERPVTLDDFVCCDTTADSRGSPVWPSVTLDNAGNIALVYLRQQVTDTSAELRLLLSRYDRTGTLKPPTVRLLPDTLSSDSVYWPTGLVALAGSASGKLFAPVHTTHNDYDHRTFGRGIRYFLLGADGNLFGEPVQVSTVPIEGNHYRPHTAIGDINSSGVCGAAWIGRQVETPYHDKLFVRLWTTETGALGDFVTPSSRPLPSSPAGMRIDRKIKGPPAFTIADDGGFAVAWIGEGEGDARIIFAVYDSTGRPRGPLRFAGSDDGSRSIVRAINMAGEADGDFYLVWSGDRTGYAEHHCRTHIWMRGFNADGSPKYDPVRVDDADSTNIIDVSIAYPSISCDDSGNVLIAWADGRLHPDNHQAQMKQDVFVQRVTPDGSRVGGNSRVNNVVGRAGLKGTHTDCALNNGGQAIIVWREFGEANTIKGQLVSLASIGEENPGDLNCDLVTDTSDLVTLRDYLLGDSPNTFWPRSQADPNRDGHVDVSDVVYLTDFLYKGGDARVP